MRKKIKTGNRAGLLATTQSTMIKELIEKQQPGANGELVRLMTKGDKILDEFYGD